MLYLDHLDKSFSRQVGVVFVKICTQNKRRLWVKKGQRLEFLTSFPTAFSVIVEGRLACLKLKMFINKIRQQLICSGKDFLQKKFTSLASVPKFHHLQEAALKENCILVDENDKPLGFSSKRDCHKVNLEGRVKLHRAFSVFLFNSNGDMLIQRRSVHKITFPDTYTNACCSHPLFDIEGERDELNAIGIRRAAQRRLHYELGIPTSQVRPENFHYLTRVHYENPGDGNWGEHEIDYILFLHKDVDLNPNPNEVSEIRFIKRTQMDEEISKLDAPLTPWFKLILKHRLKIWWDNLHQLKKFEDLKNIQRFA